MINSLKWSVCVENDANNVIIRISPMIYVLIIVCRYLYAEVNSYSAQTN